MQDGCQRTGYLSIAMHTKLNINNYILNNSRVDSGPVCLCTILSVSRWITIIDYVPYDCKCQTHTSTAKF